MNQITTEISSEGVRPPLHEELTARLREMIFSGELLGGQRVPEQKLCEHFGISRTPLREALKVLGNEGLLDLLPNRGARVAVLRPEDVDEIFPVMGALEALAGELACARLTDTDFAEIRALHYQMAVHHAKRELAPYFKLNQAIHERILDAAANPTLAAQMRALAGRIRLARFRANMTEARWDQAMREHEDMLKALEARDGRRLADVLRRHLENKRLTVKQAIADGAAEMGGQPAVYD